MTIELYLATAQYRTRSPFERTLHETLEGAIEAQQERADTDLEWEYRQGNQHAQSRWRAWEKRQDGEVTNYYVRKMEVQE